MKPPYEVKTKNYPTKGYFAYKRVLWIFWTPLHIGYRTSKRECELIIRRDRLTNLLTGGQTRVVKYKVALVIIALLLCLSIYATAAQSKADYAINVFACFIAVALSAVRAESIGVFRVVSV